MGNFQFSIFNFTFGRRTPADHPTIRPSDHPASRAGFTLPELLTVIAIIALLMMASFGALTRARVLARRARGEAQLRQLVSAWEQYFVTYNKWPGLAGQTVLVNAGNLGPLIDPDDGDNEYGIVFFNFTGTGDFLDPWGTPYRLKFGKDKSDTSNDRGTTAFETTVALPRRVTVAP